MNKNKKTAMRIYEKPTIECTLVKTGILMQTSNSVNPNRDTFDPSGGAMGNSAIWDNMEDDGTGE